MTEEQYNEIEQAILEERHWDAGYLSRIAGIPIEDNPFLVEGRRETMACEIWKQGWRAAHTEVTQ